MKVIQDQYRIPPISAATGVKLCIASSVWGARATRPDNMVTINTVSRLGKIFLMFALAMAFAMHSPMPCQAAPRSCHHNSRSAAPAMPCCQTVVCAPADARHNVVTSAPSLAGTQAPAPIAYLTPLPPAHFIAFASLRTLPPSPIPLVIELQTLLI